MIRVPALLMAGRLVAIAALVGAVALGVRDWRDARAARAELKACLVAAEDAREPVSLCPDALARAVDRSRQLADCAAAIERGDLYSERAACPAPVKQRGAELVAATARVGGLEAELAAAARRTTAAIARADSRAAALARRTAHAQSTIAAAPSGDDGLRTCDADCLRQLAGAARAGA